ncbi:MAG: Clp1/GlmU family protein [Candidatus Bathyarchaeia archaeon]
MEFMGSPIEKNLVKGNALLIRGPASLRLKSGRLDIVGAEIAFPQTIVIRRGKAVPMISMEDSSIEVLVGEGGDLQEIHENPFPEEWFKAIEEIISMPSDPFKVIIFGATDSGKTTLSTLIANKAIKNGLKTAVVDGDLGQSDIGPPTTLSMALLKRPIVDLFNAKPDKVIFIGAPSPSGREEEVIKGLALLQKEALRLGAQRIVVNTDGWMEGKGAEAYKLSLARRLEPDLVLFLKSEGYVSDLPQRLLEEGIKVRILDSPRGIVRRSREVRRELRELGYRKELRDLVFRTIPLSWLKMEDLILGRGLPIPQERLSELGKELGRRILYGEEGDEGTLLVFEEENPPQKMLEEFSERRGRKVFILQRGIEGGLLIALLGKDGEFKGLALIDEIDYERRSMRLRARYTGPIGAIKIGSVKLDEKMNEVVHFDRCPLSPTCHSKVSQQGREEAQP